MLRHGYTWVELTPISMANHPSNPDFHVARPPSNLSLPHSRANRPRPAGKWRYQFESLFGSGLVSSLWKRVHYMHFRWNLFEESVCFWVLIVFVLRWPWAKWSTKQLDDPPCKWPPKNLRFLFLGQNLLPLWAPPGVEPVAQSDSKRENLQGPDIWTLRFRKLDFLGSPTFAKKNRKYFFQSDSLLSRNALDRARLPTWCKKSINVKIVWRKCITHIKATTVKIWIYLVSWCA